MKWSTTLGLVALVSAAGVTGRALLLPQKRTPDEVLVEVQRRSELPAFDERLALRELERALQHPAARKDESLSVDLHMERANLFRSIGAYGDARAEVGLVKAIYRPEDVTLDLLSAELNAQEGSLREALQEVLSILDTNPDHAAALQLRGDLEIRQAESHLQNALNRIAEDLVADDAKEGVRLAHLIAARHMEDPSRARIVHELQGVYTERRASSLATVLTHLDNASKTFSFARESLAESFSRELNPEALRQWMDLHVRAGRPALAVDFGSAASELSSVKFDPEVLVAMLEAMADLGQADRMVSKSRVWPWKSNSAKLEIYRRAVQALATTGDLSVLSDPLRELNNLGTQEDRETFLFFNGRMRYERALRLLAEATLLEEDPQSDAAQRLLTRPVKQAVEGEDEVESPSPEVLAAELRSDAGRELEGANRQLTRFVDIQAAGPYPDARLESLQLLAEIARLQDSPTQELRQIRGLIRDFPGSAGKAYERFVQLESASLNVDVMVPERYWAHAMAQQPERTDELFDEWVRLGRESLDNRGLDFDEVYGRLVDLGQAMPAHDVGPFTLYRVAVRHFENEAFDQSAQVARALLETYPGLLPARDLAIDAAFERGAWFEAAELVLERLRSIGPDDQTRAWILELPSEVLTPELRVEIMRLDPFGLGRLTVARRFLDRGEPDRALIALRVVEDVPDLDEVVLMRGVAMHELERFSAAAREVLPLVDHETLGDEARELAVRALLAHGGELERADALDLLSGSQAQRELRMEIAENLVLKRAHVQVEPLLAGLDETAETRGGDLFLLMALDAVLADDLARSLEALERAESFSADGTAETLSMALLAYQRRWSELPDAVRRLDEASPDPDRIRETIARLYGEELEAAVDLAQSEAPELSGDPLWTLVCGATSSLSGVPIDMPPGSGELAVQQLGRTLRGTTDNPRDPRETLSLVLAVRETGWEHWAFDQIDGRIDREHPEFWLLVLEAEALTRMGRLEEAIAAWRRLTQLVPDFLPAWDRLEDQLIVKHPRDPHAPELLEVRESRARRLESEASLNRESQILLSASRLFASDKKEQCADTLSRLLSRRPEGDFPAARLLLARASRDIGRYAAAAEQYRQVMATEVPVSDHPWVPEYLDVLARSVERNLALEDRLEQREMRQHLEALRSRFSSDPLVAFHALQAEAGVQRDNIDLAVRRARALLRQLRVASDRKTLEDLRKGSTRLWTEWLLERSPDMAERELRADLAQTPGDTEVWIGLGHTLRYQGLLNEAESHWQDVLNLSDDPEAHLETARLITLRGGDLDEVDEHLEIWDFNQGTEDSALSRFLQARGELYRKGRLSNATVRTLESLWAERETLKDVSPLDLGRLYASALFVRWTPEGFKKIEDIMGELANYSVRDPYASGLVSAYEGLAVEALRVQEAAQRARKEAAERAATDEAPPTEE